MACYRELELTLLSARGLKNVNLLTRMAVYAVASISGDPLTRQCTAPDPYGGRHPCWNTTFRFAVPATATAAAAAGRSLHVLLRAERALGDRDVGEVVVPLSEILAAAAGNPGPQPPRLATYQVRKVHRGDPRGVLDVSYRLGPVVTPVEPPYAEKPTIVVPYAVGVRSPPTQPFSPPAAVYAPPQPRRPPAADVVYAPPPRGGGYDEYKETARPPQRRERSDGPAPQMGPPTQVCVGPHKQIILGGGDPTGAGSTNVSPRKAADGAGRPRQFPYQPNTGPGVLAGRRSPPKAFRQQRQQLEARQFSFSSSGSSPSPYSSPHPSTARRPSPVAPPSPRPQPPRQISPPPVSRPTSGGAAPPAPRRAAAPPPPRPSSPPPPRVAAAHSGGGMIRVS